jgi:hypothetical protein
MTSVGPTDGYGGTVLGFGGSGIFGFDGIIYSGGGAAGVQGLANTPYGNNISMQSLGGKGGGGNGAISYGYAPWGNWLGNNGDPGTGGGGGGCSSGFTASNARALAGANGGGGAVVIRTLASLNPAVTVTGSPVVRIIGNYRYYYFYATGTITF